MTTGRILQNHELNGGDTPGSANPYLRDLGFTVVAKEAAPDEPVYLDANSDEYIRTTLDSIVSSWQALGIVEWQPFEYVSFLGGYRALDIDYEEDKGPASLNLDATLHGPVIGVNFKW